ncbi:hypothetical protein D9M73_255260 [compost metagenome]
MRIRHVEVQADPAGVLDLAVHPRHHAADMQLVVVTNQRSVMPAHAVFAVDVVVEFLRQRDEAFITAHVLNHLPNLLINTAKNIVP